MLNAKIGTAPVNWNNEDVPDYRQWTPYSQMLDEMVSAGYRATEVGSQFPADPVRAFDDLAARGLEPASTFVALNLREAPERPAAVERAVERARYVKALGCGVLIVADSGDEKRQTLAGHVAPGDGLDAASWQRLAAGLSEVADRCASYGVRIVFHNHVATYVETGQELSRLMEMTDPSTVGLCLDIGHLAFGGGDVTEVMEQHGDRVGYVHLKDIDAAVLERCRRQRLGWHQALRLGIFTEFGSGSMDFRAFFDVLERRRYHGWLIVEQDTTRKTPLESATINRAYLNREFAL